MAFPCKMGVTWQIHRNNGRLLGHAILRHKLVFSSEMKPQKQVWGTNEQKKTNARYDLVREGEIIQTWNRNVKLDVISTCRRLKSVKVNLDEYKCCSIMNKILHCHHGTDIQEPSNVSFPFCLRLISTNHPIHCNLLDFSRGCLLFWIAIMVYLALIIIADSGFHTYTYIVLSKTSCVSNKVMKFWYHQRITNKPSNSFNAPGY